MSTATPFTRSARTVLATAALSLTTAVSCVTGDAAPALLNTNVIQVAAPTYTVGRYSFRCATPPGWTVKTAAGRDADVFYTCTGSAAFVCIGITPVSIQSDFLEEWRIPALRKELTSGRPFDIEASCFTTLDDTTNWVAWGVMKPDARQDGVTAVAEYHSYHIHKGFLVHLCMIAPVAEIKNQIKAFEFVRATFRSVESAN